MTITAKIIADSISPNHIRLTTLQLRYPKFIHGEFMTHRVFSRNASSSRAIPVERLIQDVLDDPAMPIFWGKNQPGMQAGAELGEEDKQDAVAIWQAACFSACARARAMAKRGAHKQIVNRIIEPWCHINVVVTSTDWANFFALRRHEGAQPEMRALADAIWEAHETSTPTLLYHGQWHLPYVQANDYHFSSVASYNNIEQDLIKLSVARCARVSYLTHEGKPPNVEEDLKLYARLVDSKPLHASPAEHQAKPDTLGNIHYPVVGWLHPDQHGNLRGWRQYRKMLAHENVSD